MSKKDKVKKIKNPQKSKKAGVGLLVFGILVLIAGIAMFLFSVEDSCGLDGLFIDFSDNLKDLPIYGFVGLSAFGLGGVLLVIGAAITSSAKSKIKELSSGIDNDLLEESRSFQGGFVPQNPVQPVMPTQPVQPVQGYQSMSNGPAPVTAPNPYKPEQDSSAPMAVQPASGQQPAPVVIQPAQPTVTSQILNDESIVKPQVVEENTFVPKTESQPSYKFCDQCGTKNDVDAKFCTNCGNRLN